MIGFVGDVDEDEEKVLPQGPPQELIIVSGEPQVVLFRADGTALVRQRPIGFMRS